MMHFWQELITSTWLHIFRKARWTLHILKVVCVAQASGWMLSWQNYIGCWLEVFEKIRVVHRRNPACWWDDVVGAIQAEQWRFVVKGASCPAGEQQWVISTLIQKHLHQHLEISLMCEQIKSAGTYCDWKLMTLPSWYELKCGRCEYEVASQPLRLIRWIRSLCQSCHVAMTAKEEAEMKVDVLSRGGKVETEGRRWDPAVDVSLAA